MKPRIMSPAILGRVSLSLLRDRKARSIASRSAHDAGRKLTVAESGGMIRSRSPGRAHRIGDPPLQPVADLDPGLALVRRDDQQHAIVACPR